MPRLIYSYLDVTNEDYGENSIMVEDYLWALIDEDLIIDESGKYSHHAGWLDREFNIRPNAYDKVLRGSIRIKEEPDKVIIMMLPYPWNDFQAKKYERNASSIEQGLKEFILEKTDKPVEIEKDLHQVYFWANQDFHDRVASKKEAKRMGRWIFVDGDVLLFGGKDSHAVDIYRHSKLKGEDFDKLLRGTLHKSDLDSDDFDYLIVFDIYTPEQDELYFKYADVVMKDMNENLNPSGERVIKEQANRYYKRTSSSLSLKLKIAKNSEDRARGYMFQEEKDVEPNTGILFVNSVPSTWGLWMANTYLPLSSAFLDKDGTILKIHKFMEPMTHKVYSSDVPAHYMVEIPMVKVAQENNYYIVIGPPASGKGTQAQLISNSFGIPHIGTGSLLREGRYPEQYEQEVQKSLTEGILLSDEIMTEILLSRLEEPDCENGFILDGFPRSVGQAESLDEFMQDKGREIKRVFNLKVSEEEILKRILGRGRADDTEEILKTRLEEYYKKTKPLENYYQDKITNIEAGVSPENTFEQIEKYATSHQTFKYAGEDYVSWFDLHNIKEGDKLIQVMPKTARTIYSQWSGEYLNKEYPETVYHVTTAKSKIMSEGPKTWKEVGDAIGFGHSKREKTGVSVTTHLDYAKKIYEDMLYSHDVLNGKISAKQVYEDGQEFALARNGERSKALDKMIKEEGGLDNIEGNLEKITKLLNFVIFIKGFAQNYVAQEFINTNIDTFKNIPRNEIAIIEMRLKRGARHNVVFDFPEDNEWRIYQSINLLPIQVVSSKISAIEDIDPFAENYIEQVVRDYIDYEIEKDRWEPRLRDYNWRNYCLRNDLGKKIYYKGLEVLNDIGFNYEKVPPMIGLAASPYMKILKQGWPTEEFVDDLNKWFDIRYLATLEPFKYIVKQYPQIGEIEYFLKKMRIRFSQKKTDWVAMTQGGLIHLNVPEMKELSDDRVVSILAHEITHFVQMMVKTPDRGSMHFIYKKFDAWLNDYFNLTHERGAFRTEVEGMLFRGLSEQDIIDELGIQIGLPLKNTKEYEEWKKDKPEDPEQYDRAWDLVEKFVHKLISDISRDFAKIAQLTPEQDEEMTYRQNGIWWVIDGKIDGAMTSDARHMNRARPEDYCTHPARMGLEMGMSHEEIDETLHGNFHYYEGHITNQIYFYLPRHYEEYDKIKPQIHQWIREKINAAQDAGTIWSALPKDIEIKDWISDCCPNRLRGNELYDTMNKHKKKWEKEDNPVSKETIEQMPFMEEPKSWSYASTKTANKYYHATFNQLFHKIMQEGLKDIAGDGGVFVADSPQKAINHFWSKYKWALNPSKYHGKSENREKRMLGLDPTKPMTIALLEVDLEPDSLESRGRYKMYPGEIPPENITFVTNLGQTVANKKRIIYAGPYMRLLKEGWPKDQYEAKKIGWTKFSDWFDIHYLMTLPQMQYLIDAYGGRDEIIRLLDRLQMKFTYAKKQRYVMRFSPSIVALTVNVAHVDYRNPTEVEQMLVHELTHYLQAASGFQFSNWRGMGEYMHTPQEQEAYMTMVYEMMNQGKSEQDIVDYFINLWGARFNLHRKVQIKAWVNHLMQWVYQDMEAREEKEQKEKAPPMLMPEFWQAAKDERRLIFAAAPLGLEDGYSRFWAIINGEIKTVEQDGSLYDTHANWLAEDFGIVGKEFDDLLRGQVWYNDEQSLLNIDAYITSDKAEKEFSGFQRSLENMFKEGLPEDTRVNWNYYDASYFGITSKMAAAPRQINVAKGTVSCPMWARQVNIEYCQFCEFHEGIDEDGLVVCMYEGEGGNPPRLETKAQYIGENGTRKIYSGSIFIKPFPKLEEGEQTDYIDFDRVFDIHYLMTLPQYKYIQKMYPGWELDDLLGNVYVQFVNSPSFSDYMQYGMGVITLNLNKLKDKSQDFIVECLMHEITHYVQDFFGKLKMSPIYDIADYFNSPDERQAFETMFYQQVMRGKSKEEIYEDFVNMFKIEGEEQDINNTKRFLKRYIDNAFRRIEKKAKTKFKPGDKVRIISGRLEGYYGKIDKYRNKTPGMEYCWVRVYNPNTHKWAGTNGFSETSLEKVEEFPWEEMDKEARRIYADKSDMIFDKFNESEFIIIKQETDSIVLQPKTDNKSFKKYIEIAEEMARDVFSDAKYLGTQGDDTIIIGYSNPQKVSRLIYSKVLYSGVLDLPQLTLDPDLWQEDEEPPVLEEDVKNTIIDKFNEWVDSKGIGHDWVQNIYFIGSSAGYQYRSTSDIDITIVPDLDILTQRVEQKYPENEETPSIKQFIREMMAELNGYHIFEHDVNYYIRQDATIPVGESIYDINTDTWIKSPKPLPEDYAPEEEFKSEWLQSESRLGPIDEAIGKLRRRLEDYDILSEYLDTPTWKEKIIPRIENKKESIEQWVQWLGREYKDIWNARARAYKVQESQTSKENIVYKFLERYGYLDLLHKLFVLRNKEPDQEYIDTVKSALDEFGNIE